MVKLPVFETTGHALTAPFRFIWPLFPFYLVLQLGMVGVLGAFSTVGATSQGEAGLAVETASLPLAIVAGLVLYAALVMLAVLTHRLIAGIDEPWRLGRPSVAYFLVALIFSVIALGIFAFAFATTGGTLMTATVPGESPPLSGMQALILIVLYVLFIIAFLRLGLALPAAALEQSRPLMLGFKASRGNAWRLFGCFFLIVIASMLVSTVLALGAAALGIVTWPPADENVQGLANAFDLSDPSALGMLSVNVLTNYFMTVASTAFLTYSLRALWPNVEQAEDTRIE